VAGGRKLVSTPRKSRRLWPAYVAAAVLFAAVGISVAAMLHRAQSAPDASEPIATAVPDTEPESMVEPSPPTETPERSNTPKSDSDPEKPKDEPKTEVPTDPKPSPVAEPSTAPPANTPPIIVNQKGKLPYPNRPGAVRPIVPPPNPVVIPPRNHGHKK
jgi:hypothetical protein